MKVFILWWMSVLYHIVLIAAGSIWSESVQGSPFESCEFKVHLSDNQQLVESATQMQANIEAADPEDVIRFDDPETGLHMSMTYACCHSAQETALMLETLPNFKWNSFLVNFSTFGCNVDMHDNSTIYLHALPDETSQNLLFELMGELYGYWESFGIPINHPRQSLFHMTLARVNYNYPTDQVVEQYQDYFFGVEKLCSFSWGGVASVALDCQQTRARY